MADRKDDRLVMQAIRSQNNGQHTTAAVQFQRAGNQYRHPDEKKALWAAADRCRRIAATD